MKVLLVHQAFASHQGAGGTRHFELAKYCIERGVEFTVVTSPVNYLTGTFHRSATDDSNLTGLEIKHAKTIRAHHKNFIWRVLAFVGFMFSAMVKGLGVKNIDVVMGTTPPIFQTVSAWMIAFVKRKPFLLEVRDLWPEFAIDMGVLKDPLLIRLSRWLEHFLYRQADHIIVNSPAYRDYLIDKKVAADKIDFIPNGVDTNMFSKNQTTGMWQKKWHLEEKFIIVYTGALGLANHIDTILEAAQHLLSIADLHFLLIGDGKERKRLEQVAKQKHLTNMTFTGAIPKSNIPAILAECNAGVATLKNIPMFQTTYPNKVFDYMAAGLPVLLAIDGVIRQLVEQAEGGLFSVPGDAMALASNVRYLYEHPEISKEMGQHAGMYVAQHFDRQQQAKDFFQLVEKLAG